MYTPLKDRLFAAFGAALIVVLLGYMLLSGLTVRLQARGEQALALLKLSTPPPPPPPKPPEKHILSEKKSGKASPRNLRNKATPIVAPPPIVLPPPLPPPVIAAPKPNVGMASQSGASNRPGPGQGAGGEGNGFGGGGEGEGEGGDTPPRALQDRMKISWLPPEVRHMIGPVMAIVHVTYSVETNGRVGTCEVTGSSGNGALDTATCAAIQQRFRFKPAHDPNGVPFRTHIVDSVGWQMDRDTSGEPSRSKS